MLGKGEEWETKWRYMGWRINMPIANFKLTLPLGVSLINIQQIFDVDIL